jgi:hypothetical protein
VTTHPVTVMEKAIIKLLHDDIKEKILVKEFESRQKTNEVLRIYF